MSSNPIDLSWAMTAPTSMLSGRNAKDVLMEVIQSRWETEMFPTHGPMADYTLVGSTHGWSRIDAYQKFQFDK